MCIFKLIWYKIYYRNGTKKNNYISKSHKNYYKSFKQKIEEKKLEHISIIHQLAVAIAFSIESTRVDSPSFTLRTNISPFDVYT